MYGGDDGEWRHGHEQSETVFFALPRFVLRTGKDGSEAYQVNDYITGLRLVYVHLPRM